MADIGFLNPEGLLFPCNVYMSGLRYKAGSRFSGRGSRRTECYYRYYSRKVALTFNFLTM